MSRLPRPVRLFGAVSLLNDAASEMVYPLLPAFLTAGLGAGPVALGALDGAAEFAAAAVKYRAGRVADRPRARGPLILAGYAIAVLVRPAVALAGAAWHVVALRVTDRLGKGVRTPARDALIAEVAPAPLHGRAFGLQRGLDHVGAVLGPLVAWYLLAGEGLEVRTVIAASIVPGLAVLVLAIMAVKAGNGRHEAARATPPLPPIAAVSRPLPPSVLAIAAFYLLRMPETLLLLRSQQLGVSVAAVPLLWASVHVAKSGASFVGGALSDRIGPGRTMWLGWAVYAAVAAAFALAVQAWAAWALFLAFGLVAGLTESPERALVARLAGVRQGTGFGVYHAATGMAALVGGLVLGLVYDQAGGGAAFWASAAAGLVLAACGAAVRVDATPGD